MAPPTEPADPAFAETATPTAGDTAAGGRAIRGTAAGEPGPGTTLGRFQLIEAVGEGGMGVVFRAVDVDLEREVAIKVLHRRDEDRHRDRLLVEARAMAKLRHPNVVIVYEAGTSRDADYIAMDLFDGGTLRDWLKTPRPWREVVKRFVDAGEGLCAAHAAGIVHRDFKPSNVLLDSDGSIAVGDFGLAIAPTYKHDSAPMIGTPAYMAPEQFRGSPVDARTDQYSFCVALYEALWRQHPHGTDGEMVELAQRVLRGVVRPPPSSDVPARVRRAVLRGLAVDPAARHRDLKALLHELRGALALRKRVALTAATNVAIVGIVAAVAIANRSSSTAPAVTDACAGDGFEVAWPGPREAVTRAFAARAELRDSVLGAMDEYAAGWRDRWRRACERERGDTVAFHDVAACLYDARDEAAALTRELTAPSDALRDGALAAIEDLPAPARCVAGTGPARPADPALAAKVRTIESQLAQVRAMRAAGTGPALATAWNALAQAIATQHRPVIASARLEVGYALHDAQDIPGARAVLAEASIDAEQAGDALARAEALVGIASIESAYSSDATAMAHAARQAAAAVTRAGAPPEQRVELEHAWARIANRGGRPDDALAHLDAAVAIQRAEGWTSGAAWTEIQRATILREVDRADEAVALLDRERETLVATLGADHETITELDAERMACLHWSGRYAEAQAERARLRARRPAIGDGAVVVTGTVRDASGAPVPGATVMLAHARLHGDARAAIMAIAPALETDARLREVKTGADGRFEARVDAGPLHVLVEHDAAGRAAPLVFASAPTNAIAVTLAPWVEVRGRVIGAPPRSHVHITPKGTSQYQLEVVIVDGEFHARIPAGPHRIELLHNDNWVRGYFAREDVIARAGRPLDVELRVDGTVTVTVELRLGGDLSLPGGFAAMLPGKVSPAPTTMALLMPAFDAGTPYGLAYGSAVAIEDGRATATLGPMTPGTYTLCGAALPGDIRDPVLQRKAYANMGAVSGVCTHVEVKASPTEQTLTLEVPPPSRIPE